LFLYHSYQFTRFESSFYCVCISHNLKIKIFTFFNTLILTRIRTMATPTRIVLVGPPRSGKKTIVQQLCQTVHDPCISNPKISHHSTTEVSHRLGPNGNVFTILPGTQSGKETHDKVIEMAPYVCVIVLPHGEWNPRMEKWLNDFLATPVCNRTILAITRSESLIGDDGANWVYQLKQVCEPLNMIRNQAIVFTGAITESDINIGDPLRLDRLQTTCKNGIEQLRSKLI